MINFQVENILFNLPTVNKESSINLRKLIDTIQHHISALEKLKLPVDKWNALLIPLILSKLDDRTCREWELKQSNVELPTLEDLIDFLVKKYFALETFRDFSSSKEKTEKDYSNFRPNYEKKNERNVIVKTTVIL